MPPPNHAHDAVRDNSDDAFHWTAATFGAGERICPPGAKRRAGSFRSVALAVGIVAAGAWSHERHPDVWSDAWSRLGAVAAEVAGLPSVKTDTPPVASAKPAAEAPAMAAVGPSLAAAREVADAPGRDVGQAVPSAAPVTTGEVKPDGAVAEGAAEQPSSPGDTVAARGRPEPLTKPTADPSDPQQRRALAVGLHPDLSQAVLKRLSGTDFKNAGIAIAKALGASPDGASVSWPAENARFSKLAQFDVRFVASSAPDCRRYVVTVTLDRWSTTAPAMETCAAELPPPRGRSSSG